MNQAVLILPDQLSTSLMSYANADPKRDALIFIEQIVVFNEIEHHQKKLAFIFSAMRHFAQSARKKGFHVIYHRINPTLKKQLAFDNLLTTIINTNPIKTITMTKASDYHIDSIIASWCKQHQIELIEYQDNRFLCSIDAFKQWAQGRSQLTMGYFYRWMRKQHNILMDGDQPIGGQWSFDQDNRKPPKKGMPKSICYEQQIDDITRQAIADTQACFSNHFGDLEPFYFAVTHQDARQALDHFISHRLANFGDYQDAMVADDPMMFHAHISFYLNIGLLDPLECIQAVEACLNRQDIGLNAIEGFIRQILGWREYVRGLYWLFMPGYEQVNHLNAQRDLPSWYWTGHTDMACLSTCIKQTKRFAYAHHIQRLMVLGNFALLTGIHPKWVNHWFLIVYADAYPWVELPNVSGMILFADGGKLASKPYAASGAYIHKMSDYCQGCRYDVKSKQGPNACPFNYLYWHFMKTNREKLAPCGRIGMMYRTYDRMDEDKKKAIARDAQNFFAEHWNEKT